MTRTPEKAKASLHKDLKAGLLTVEDLQAEIATLRTKTRKAALGAATPTPATSSTAAYLTPEALECLRRLGL